jgi:nucleoside-diphosphate-sugar epimerase
MRDVTAIQLVGYAAMLCLAALSNDPLGDLNPAATYAVNLDDTLHLARMARQAGVPRSLFSPSRSLNGGGLSGGSGGRLPLTGDPYGESKVMADWDSASWRTTISAPRTCVTRPRTAPRQGSGRTSW